MRADFAALVFLVEVYLGHGEGGVEVALAGGGSYFTDVSGVEDVGCGGDRELRLGGIVGFCCLFDFGECWGFFCALVVFEENVLFE